MEAKDGSVNVDTLVRAIFQQVTDNLKIVQDTHTKVTLRNVTTTTISTRPLSFNVVGGKGRTPVWPEDDDADNLYDVELEVDIEPERCGMYSNFTAANASIGSKWRKIGPTAPERGRDLTNETGLVTALNTKKEFTESEMIKNGMIRIKLRHDDYIKSGDDYYAPTAMLPFAEFVRDVLGENTRGYKLGVAYATSGTISISIKLRLRNNLSVSAFGIWFNSIRQHEHLHVDPVNARKLLGVFNSGPVQQFINCKIRHSPVVNALTASILSFPSLGNTVGRISRPGCAWSTEEKCKSLQESHDRFKVDVGKILHDLRHTTLKECKGTFRSVLQSVLFQWDVLGTIRDAYRSMDVKTWVADHHDDSHTLTTQ